jgi:hypothetical protein
LTGLPPWSISKYGDRRSITCADPEARRSPPVERMLCAQHHSPWDVGQACHRPTSESIDVISATGVKCRTHGAHSHIISSTHTTAESMSFEARILATAQLRGTNCRSESACGGVGHFTIFQSAIKLRCAAQDIEGSTQACSATCNFSSCGQVWHHHGHLCRGLSFARDMGFQGTGHCGF